MFRLWRSREIFPSMPDLVTYHLEPWAQYFADCQQLWLEHYDEIAVLKDKKPMSPDVSFYRFY